MRVRAQYFSQHRARAAADVDHGPNGIPAPSNLKFGIWSSVSLWSDKGVEFGGDLGMGIEILPEWLAKHLLVCRNAAPHVGKEGAPGIGHPAADSFKIQAQVQRGIEETSRGIVQCESARSRLLENASAYQVPEHAV